MYMYIYGCMYICMYIYIYIYRHIPPRVNLPRPTADTTALLQPYVEQHVFKYCGTATRIRIAYSAWVALHMPYTRTYSRLRIHKTSFH